METIIENNNEYIKLIKNTKGYQWEIKIINREINDATIHRLNEIDKKLRQDYGQNIDNIQMKGGTEQND